jgi:hypothetical protein
MSMGDFVTDHIAPDNFSGEGLFLGAGDAAG